MGLQELIGDRMKKNGTPKDAIFQSKTLTYGKSELGCPDAG